MSHFEAFTLYAHRANLTQIFPLLSHARCRRKCDGLSGEDGEAYDDGVAVLDEQDKGPKEPYWGCFLPPLWRAEVGTFNEGVPELEVEEVNFSLASGELDDFNVFKLRSGKNWRSDFFKDEFTAVMEGRGEGKLDRMGGVAAGRRALAAYEAEKKRLAGRTPSASASKKARKGSGGAGAGGTGRGPRPATPRPVDSMTAWLEGDTPSKEAKKEKEEIENLALRQKMEETKKQGEHDRAMAAMTMALEERKQAAAEKAAEAAAKACDAQNQVLLAILNMVQRSG